MVHDNLAIILFLLEKEPLSVDLALKGQLVWAFHKSFVGARGLAVGCCQCPHLQTKAACKGDAKDQYRAVYLLGFQGQTSSCL